MDAKCSEIGCDVLTTCDRNDGTRVIVVWFPVSESRVHRVKTQVSRNAMNTFGRPTIAEQGNHFCCNVAAAARQRSGRDRFECLSSRQLGSCTDRSDHRCDMLDLYFCQESLKSHLKLSRNVPSAEDIEHRSQF